MKWNTSSQCHFSSSAAHFLINRLKEVLPQSTWPLALLDLQVLWSEWDLNLVKESFRWDRQGRESARIVVIHCFLFSIFEPCWTLLDEEIFLELLQYNAGGEPLQGELVMSTSQCHTLKRKISSKVQQGNMIAHIYIYVYTQYVWFLSF